MDEQRKIDKLYELLEEKERKKEYRSGCGS